MSRINNLRESHWETSPDVFEIMYLYEDDNGSTKVIGEGTDYYAVEDNVAVLSVMDEQTIEIWNDNVDNGIENYLFTDYKSVSEYWGMIRIEDYNEWNYE